MKIQKVAKILEGQDGAIYGTELFRFDTFGECSVYDISALNGGKVVELAPIAQFKVDRVEELAPHSNSVCFGCEFYEEGDRYPLLYTNIYNNYADAENKLFGVCLVYRIQREGNDFKSTLVQAIEIGFCEDAELWKATPDGHGVRPYGNFVIDAVNRAYWAFVMRNEELGTRYFRFDLPSVFDGELDPVLNVRKAVLKAEDVREFFDCEYHRYIQGATLRDGVIYSTEGFRDDTVNRPAIRLIGVTDRSEKYFDITELGYWDEPECISFLGDTCLYSDASGNVYEVEF